ncbi:hypothetical protein BGX29_009520 [Mortierella sp. GBA35]|nr:hypothetical protein BGX29_009520 [Mortierella sp. GBA35]
MPTSQEQTFSYLNYKTHIALVQSNDRPLNVDNITWSLVSVWPRREVEASDAYSSLACHVNPTTGVFTMMSNFSSNNPPPSPSPASASNISLREPGGLQYNPATGSWTEFVTSPDYVWGNVSATFALFDWPKTSTLYQATIGALNGTIVNLGMLDNSTASASGEGAKFVNVASWRLDPAIHGFPIKLAYANNSIYQFGSVVSDSRTGAFSHYMTRIPLDAVDGKSLKVPTGLVAYDAAAIKNCQMETTRVWFSKDTLYVLCPMFTSGTDVYTSRQTFLLSVSRFKDGDKALSVPANSSIASPQGIIQPIATGESSNPWIYLGSSYGRQEGVSLEPYRLGPVMYTAALLNISEPYGKNVVPLPEYYKPDHTTTIIGGSAAGLVVLVLAVLYRPIKRRWPGLRKRWSTFKSQNWPQWKRTVRLKLIEILKDDNDSSNSDGDNRALHEGKTDISDKGGEDEYNNKIEEFSMTSLDLEGCDKILVTDDMDLSGLENAPKMDVATGYMNGIRLESHPRPAVVTTLTMSKSDSSHGTILQGQVASRRIPSRDPPIGGAEDDALLLDEQLNGQTFSTPARQVDTIDQEDEGASKRVELGLGGQGYATQASDIVLNRQGCITQATGHEFGGREDRTQVIKIGHRNSSNTSGGGNGSNSGQIPLRVLRASPWFWYGVNQRYRNSPGVMDDEIEDDSGDETHTSPWALVVSASDQLSSSASSLAGPLKREMADRTQEKNTKDALDDEISCSSDELDEISCSSDEEQKQRPVRRRF